MDSPQNWDQGAPQAEESGRVKSHFTWSVNGYFRKFHHWGKGVGIQGRPIEW